MGQWRSERLRITQTHSVSLSQESLAQEKDHGVRDHHRAPGVQLSAELCTQNAGLAAVGLRGDPQEGSLS